MIAWFEFTWSNNQSEYFESVDDTVETVHTDLVSSCFLGQQPTGCLVSGYTFGSTLLR